MENSEIFNHISTRLVEAVMMHSNFDDLFRYIGMPGFAKTQLYQFICENREMKSVNYYCIEHLNLLVANDDVSFKKYLPKEFIGVGKIDVSALDKRDVVRYIIETWVEWEKGTKELYSNLSISLNENHDTASSLFVDELIKDVDLELKRATDLLVWLKNIDYDMCTIMLFQDDYCRTYDIMICNKLKENERRFKDEYHKLS